MGKVETEAEKLLRLAGRVQTSMDPVCQCDEPDFEHDRQRLCLKCGVFVQFDDEADLLDWIEAMKTPRARGAR